MQEESRELQLLKKIMQKIEARIEMAESQLAQSGSKADDNFKLMCNEKIFELSWVLKTIEAELKQLDSQP